MEMRIYVANLAAYNAGRLVGEWIDLPIDEEDLQEKLNEISAENNANRLQRIADGDDEGDELAIHDYEFPRRIGEYDDICALNRLAQVIEDSDEDENIIRALLDEIDISETIDDIIKTIEDSDYIAYADVDGLDDVAYSMMQDSGQLAELEKMPSLIEGVNMSSYVDWESMGRDLRHYGWSYHPGYRVAISVQ